MPSSIKPQMYDKKQIAKLERSVRLFKILTLFSIVGLVILLYFLCLTGVFCFTDLWGKQRTNTQHAGTGGQSQLILQDTILTLTNVGSVDLSGLQTQYSAGEGLKLEDHQFSLEETGVVSGTYGSRFSIPVLSVDRFGRIVYAYNVPIPQPPEVQQATINNMQGPDFTIEGTPNQVNVTSADNKVTLSLPQDIDTSADVQFNSLLVNDLTTQNSLEANGVLRLNGQVYDSAGNLGGTGRLLVSANNKLQWQDIGSVVDDNQTLNWDPATFDLSIEDGNTVNLGDLAIWKREPIGGAYSTDVLSPRLPGAQRILLEHTGWGLTELQIRNNDNISNYAGAVVNLKNTGEDYTNNMFLAKLGDSYYVRSWAGRGVVASDQPLVLASVRSNDPAHPNLNPFILFQTGGYYTAPVDRMILDSQGNLGINDFGPVEKLTVGGNIALTDTASARIYSTRRELEIGTNTNPVRIYSDNIVHLAVDSSNNMRGRVYVGTNRDPTSIPGNENKLFVVVSNSDRYAPLVSVRYSNTIAGPVALYYKARGRLNAPQVVRPDDVLGGYNSLGYNGAGGTGWQMAAQLRHRVYDVINGNVVPYIEFKHRQPNGAYIDVARMLYDGRFGIGNIDPEVTLDLTPVNGTPVALNIRPFGSQTGILTLEDTVGGHIGLRAPSTITSPYNLVLPSELGNTYDVLYHAGSGQLGWDSVEHLLSIAVGDHAVLYSNGTNIVGDPNAFYWDYTNNRLGINMDGAPPDSQLSVRMTTDRGVYFWDDSTGDYPKLMVVAKCDTNPFNCTRIQIDQGSIRATYYAGYRWSLGRDEFGSARAGLRLNSINGVWADRFDLNLRARNYDALRIIASGAPYSIITDPTFNVGIGTTSPQERLVVQGKIWVRQSSIFIDVPNPGGAWARGVHYFPTNQHSGNMISGFGSYGEGSDFMRIYFAVGDRPWISTLGVYVLETGEVGVHTLTPTHTFQVGEAGDGTDAIANAWVTFSDERFKDNIRDIHGALEAILNLRGVEFTWKKSGQKSVGFIAQEVDKVLPQIVVKGKDGYLGLDYTKVIPYLVESIKELNRRIDELGGGIEPMKTTPQALEATKETSAASGTEFWTLAEGESQILQTTYNVQVPSLVAKSANIAKLNTESLTANSAQVKSLKADAVKTSTLTIDAGSKNKGVVVIPQGSSEVRVTVDSLSRQDLVLVTQYSGSPTAFVVERNNGYFVIKLSEPASQDSEFGWLIVGVE